MFQMPRVYDLATQLFKELNQSDLEMLRPGDKMVWSTQRVTNVVAKVYFIKKADGYPNGVSILIDEIIEISGEINIGPGDITLAAITELYVI